MSIGKMFFARAIMIVFCLGSMIGLASSVKAQQAHAEVRPGLVYLKAKGQVKSGPNTSAFVESQGTGVLVTEDGLILTTHHLITELDNIVPRTLTIEARIKDKTAVARKAAIIDGAVNTDLLLLKLPPPPQGEPFTKVKLGDAYHHDDGKDIYTSGFPAKGVNYIQKEGKIESRDGPGGYLWTTNFAIEKGQSGSPVYNENGEVIGVLKGDQGSQTYMIPIEFADTLLAYIRLREIRTDIRAFDPLKRKMEWKVKPAYNNLEIQYEKMLPGPPFVKEIDVFVSAWGEKKDVRTGEIAWMETEPIVFKSDVEDPKFKKPRIVSAIGNIGHLFKVEDAIKLLVNRLREQKFQNASELCVYIRPRLDVEDSKNDAENSRNDAEDSEPGVAIKIRWLGFLGFPGA